MAKKSKKERVPLQVAGMPQGKHLTGFKGSKDQSGAICLCAGCHPNALKQRDKVIYR